MTDEDVMNHELAKIAIRSAIKSARNVGVTDTMIGSELAVQSIVLLEGCGEDRARERILAGIKSATAHLSKQGRG
ncbi:MAG: hypothetical protein KF748_01180 [Xanthobacteraceae bacterium]|nr:hypothetical protein [Xanthobacteraceae bacterium]